LLLNQNPSHQLVKEEVKMKSLLRLLLKTQHQQNCSGQAQKEKGMTLVELLVGAIMAFLIITPMLAFVVDMLNTDRREQVKANTEQDIQAAVDFIAQDLSQAIYIYDNAGITAIKSNLPTPTSAQVGTPILVFWKRKQVKNAVSVDTDPLSPNRVLPKDCNTTPNKPCNDTYVRSLIAYYQIKDDTAGIWCQPQGSPCPTRIVRYEIHEGIVKDSTRTDASRYYSGVGQEVNQGQEVSPGFNPMFDFSQPTQNVTQGSTFPQPEVLVNYIDHTPTAVGPSIDPAECQKALGNPTATVPGQLAPVAIPEQTLKVTGPDKNSFYACVDTARNIARVTIRGNSLRRLQPNDAEFKATSSAFFPTASVQVQGRGALGK
jgi:type II secretory pathway pseudopilin PulG